MAGISVTGVPKSALDHHAGSIIALAWQSLVYGLGIHGRRLAVLLLLPFLTSHMDQLEFGAVSVLIAFLSFVDGLSNAGLPAATFRLYNDTDDPQTRRRILGSSCVLFSLYAVITAVVVWILAVPISSWLLGDAAYSNLVRIVAAVLVFATLNYFGHILLRIQVRPLTTSLQSLLQTGAQLGLALLLVVGFSLGARGYWLGQLGGEVLGLFVMAWLVRKMVSFAVSRRRMKELMLYALPMIPAALSLWALRLVDRVLLAQSVGLEEVAVYEVGYKVGMLTALVIGPFLVAWPQFAFSRMHQPDAPETYRIVLTYIAATSLFAALCVITFSPELVAILATERYDRAVLVVPWIALSQVAWGLYPVMSLGAKISKRTSYLAWVTCVASVVNIVLNLILIPVVGIVGAAIATLVAYIVLSGTVYAVGQRIYPFPIDWKRLAKLALAAGLTALLVTVLRNLDVSVWQSRILRAAGVLAFPCLLFATGFVTFDQGKAMWQTGIHMMRGRIKRAQPS